MWTSDTWKCVYLCQASKPKLACSSPLPIWLFPNNTIIISSSTLVEFLYFCLSRIISRHWEHYDSAVSTGRGLHIRWGFVTQQFLAIIIKPLYRKVEICWKKDIRVSAVLRHYNDIGHPLSSLDDPLSSPLSSSRVSALDPFGRELIIMTQFRGKVKMLLLVLQPLILYCVNNKLLALKLNRHCTVHCNMKYFCTSAVYLSMIKMDAAIYSCWSLI